MGADRSASRGDDGGAWEDGRKVWTRVRIWKTDDMTPAKQDFSFFLLPIVDVYGDNAPDSI